VFGKALAKSFFFEKGRISKKVSFADSVGIVQQENILSKKILLIITGFQ